MTRKLLLLALLASMAGCSGSPSSLSINRIAQNIAKPEPPVPAEPAPPADEPELFIIPSAQAKRLGLPAENIILDRRQFSSHVEYMRNLKAWAGGLVAVICYYRTDCKQPAKPKEATDGPAEEKGP